MKNRLTSRKFWVSIVTTATLVGSQVFGLNLDSTEQAGIAVVGAVYVFGEAIVDAVAAFKATHTHPTE